MCQPCDHLPTQNRSLQAKLMSCRSQDIKSAYVSALRPYYPHRPNACSLHAKAQVEVEAEARSNTDGSMRSQRASMAPSMQTSRRGQPLLFACDGAHTAAPSMQKVRRSQRYRTNVARGVRWRHTAAPSMQMHLRYLRYRANVARCVRCHPPRRVHLHVHIDMCSYTSYIYAQTHTHICRYIYAYVDVYIHIRIYTHTHSRRSSLPRTRSCCNATPA